MERKMLFIEHLKTVAIVMASSLFTPTLALACASCGCMLSSDWNNKSSANSSDINVDFRYDYLDQDQLRSAVRTITPQAASQIINNGNPQEVEQYTQNHYLTLGLSYSINTDFGVSAQVPFIIRRHSTLGTASDGTIAGDGGGQYVSRTSSIGDMKILLNYQGFLSRHSLGIIAGLKIPSGSFTKTGTSTDTTAPGPAAIDRGLQPGTGTTDIILGLSYFDKFNTYWNYFVQGLYQIALDSRDDYRPGKKET
jgi:hypothetical protein